MKKVAEFAQEHRGKTQKQMPQLEDCPISERTISRWVEINM